MADTTQPPIASPPTLVAIAIAARRTGDLDLEREVLAELQHQGIHLTFAADRWPRRPQELHHAR